VLLGLQILKIENNGITSDFEHAFSFSHRILKNVDKFCIFFTPENAVLMLVSNSLKIELRVNSMEYGKKD
jgi:hypothetical protein